MRFTRQARLGLAIIAVVPLTLSMTAPRSTTRRLCDVARDWADAHPGDYPRTLDDMDRLPYPVRKQVYGRLARDTRIAMWREKLNAYSRPDSGLTVSQLALLRETIARLPDLVGDSTGSRGRATMAADSLPQRLLAAFGRDKARPMFLLLGTTREIDVHAAPASVRRALEAAGLLGSAAAKSLTPCSCAADFGEYDCWPNGTCIGGSSAECGGPIIPACGPFGDYTSDGHCG